ncbi:MAG TPA: PadR family transcriptional regulator [Nitrososphaerales archaeon]|nr:PadR family transcriptional regulator [Nitrososphaerales archaeon]
MASLMSPVSDVDHYVRKYRRGMVNSLLEYLILEYAAEQKLCGYDVITLLHERFHTLLSPGQVYPVIDQMTEQGLLRKERSGRSVLLEASHLGHSLLKAWRQEFRAIQTQLVSRSEAELQAVA